MWWAKVRLVLQKCWLAKRRAPKAALFELLAPIIVVVVLVSIKPSVESSSLRAPEIKRIRSSITAGPFSMMESLCCGGQPDVSDLPANTTYDRGPFIRVATRLASSDLLNPSLLTSLFCKISENLVAATHAAPPPELVAFCAGQPPPPPMPPPLPGQTQGWQSRLGACIALFRDSHRASQISARYKAPLIFVDCLNTIAPFVVNNSDGTFAGIGDAVKDAAKAVLPTKQLNEMLFVLAGITTAFYNWDENGDNVGRFTEGIRMARLTGSVHGAHAVLAMCSPFCPQNVDDLPVWNQSGQPPGDIDGRNLVEDLEGIFGGLEYYFSPDTVITRAIMDAALAPYNDLALMMRFISTMQSLGSMESRTAGDKRVCLKEVWWCSDDEVGAIRDSRADSATGVQPSDAPPPRPPNWTLAHEGSVEFQANGFRKNSFKTLTADLIVPKSDKHITFSVSGECVNWHNCAAPGGLCECNTTVRYLVEPKVNAQDSSTLWRYSNRKEESKNGGSSQVICTTAHLDLDAAAVDSARVLACQCASEVVCKADLFFGDRETPANLKRVLTWESEINLLKNDSGLPIATATSKIIPVKSGTRYRMVLNVFNGADGEQFELNAVVRSKTKLHKMLRFPRLGNASEQHRVWVLPSIPPLPSQQFPNLTPNPTAFQSKEEMIAAVNRNWINARGVHFEYSVPQTSPTLLPDEMSEMETRSSSTPTRIQYSVHYSPDIPDIPTTHKKGSLRPVYSLWGIKTWQSYAKSSVTPLLECLNYGIERMYAAPGGDDERMSPLLYQALPTPAYKSGHFLYSVRVFLPLVLVLVYIYPVSILVKSIVVEKEEKLQEVMKIAGLSNALNWFGWFVVSFIFAECTSVILVVLLKYGNIMEHSSTGVLLLFFSLVTLSTICLSFLFSVFFSKARVAASVAGLTYFLLYLPSTLISSRGDEVSRGTKLAASLITPTAFGLGCTAIAEWELMMLGVNGQTFGERTPSLNVSLAEICAMLVVDSIGYMVIAIYIDAVWPGEFGQGRHPFYFLQPSMTWLKKTWRAVLHVSSRVKNLSVRVEDNIDDGIELIEREPGLTASLHTNNGDRELLVSIKQVCKRYSSKSPMVLTNVTLQLAKGQITTLLGSNGAGKSTLLNILTGLIPATSGAILIDGYNLNLSADLFHIRQNVGVCLQQNVLFPFMTVAEHVDLFLGLRSAKTDSNRNDVSSLLSEVGLLGKTACLARNLSGGQKRKLSVVLAFVGNPKLVILDEPTAGVDPDSRRKVWEMILKSRRNQTVLLCTHHMDEADLLSDQVACISDGTIKCVGTVETLKRDYGGGSTMTFQLADVEVGTAAVEVKTDLLKTVQRRIPGATAHIDGGTAEDYQIRLAGATSQQITQTLETLQQANGSVPPLGVCAPSLKDVFITLAEEGEDEREGGAGTNGPANDNDGDGALAGVAKGVPKASGFALAAMQIRGILRRRLLHSIRDTKAIFAQFVLPVVFVLLAMLVATSLPASVTEPELLLSRKSVYPSAHVIPVQSVCPARRGQAESLSDASVFRDFSTNVVLESNVGTTLTKIPACTNFTDYLLSSHHNGNGDVAFKRIPRAAPITGSTVGARFDPDIYLGNSFNDGGDNESTTSIISLWESRNYHGLPILISTAGSSLARRYTNATIAGSLAPTAHRLDLGATQYLKSGIDVVVTIFIVLALSFIPASVVLQLVQNRESGLTHLQITSGLSPLVFWLSNFAFDLAMYSLSTILVLVCIGSFDLPAFAEHQNMMACGAIMWLYGFATIPLA